MTFHHFIPWNLAYASYRILIIPLNHHPMEHQTFCKRIINNIIKFTYRNLNMTLPQLNKHIQAGRIMAGSIGLISRNNRAQGMYPFHYYAYSL